MGETLTAADQDWLHSQLSLIVVLAVTQHAENPTLVGVLVAQVGSVREAVDAGNGHHVRERMLCLQAGLQSIEGDR